MCDMFRSLLFLSLFLLISCSKDPDQMQYPESEKNYLVEDIHGYEVEDSYRWLEDFTSDKSIDWVKRQNKFTNKFIENTAYKDSISSYLSDIWDADSRSIPFNVSDKTFYYFNDGSWQQSKLMMRKCPDCEFEVLLDPNTFSKDGTFSLAGISISNDAKYMAYSISDGGSDWRTWKLLNLETKEQLEDEILWSKFSIPAWENDSSGFYYQKYEEPEDELLKDLNSSPKLMFHKIGTDQNEDVVAYENKDKPRWSWGIRVVKDSDVRFLSISEGTDERNRLYFKTANDKTFKPIIDELRAAYSLIGYKDGLFWFYTTENAKNGKVVSLEINGNDFIWKEVVAEKQNNISSISLINNSFVINYMVDTFSEIYFYTLEGNLVNKLEGFEGSTISGFGGNIDDQKTYFSINNFIKPKEIYEIDLATLQTDLFWKEDLKNYDPNEFVSDFTFFTSKDGTQIPMHISYKKSLELTKDTPVMLYGYGGFNIPMRPRFSKSHAAWKKHNGVYAVVNLRGGSEYGDSWHEQGMLLNKQNVFDDFAYAAKFLHASKIGSPKTTAIIGGSNGGLLVAATMLQEPDLFEVAIPQVGVLDMLRFHKFTIGWAWESDYGSPDNKVEFENLLAYSPYHNIEAGKCYPKTLVTTASRDDRVVPSHSFKFAARLQELQSCDNPVLIRVEDRAGHGAGTPKSKIIDQISEIYGYALQEVSS